MMMKTAKMVMRLKEMVNNKRKGKRVEREATKKMETLTGMEWKRTVFSGAMSKHRNNPVYQGDIHCTEDEELNKDLHVEVKARKDSIKLQELYNEKSLFWKYCRQAEKDRKENDKEAYVLLIKVNREGWFFISENIVPALRFDLDLSRVEDHSFLLDNIREGDTGQNIKVYRLK